MSVAPGSTRRIIAPHSSQYLAPPHVLRRTVLLNVLVAHCERWSTAPLPPVVTPTPATITPITFPTDLAVHDGLTEWLVR
jgi:hypothetical protein